MDLSVSERLQLLSILPKEGNIVTLRLVNDFSKILSFDENEIAKLNLKILGNQITWDDKVEFNKSVLVGPVMNSLIVELLSGLNNSNKLNLGQVSLYEKFMENKNG